LAERTAVRHYLIGLLLPRERNKTLTELAALVPGADRQRLHHIVREDLSSRDGVVRALLGTPRERRL
jgi:hypothetical protein